MAGKSIRMLDKVAGIYDDSLLPVDQDGKMMSATGKQFREFAEAAAEQYVEDATEVAQKAEQALAALGNDAQIAQKAAASATESEKKAKLYADQTEASVSGVASFNGRGGHVMPQAGDYTADMVGAAPDGHGLGKASDANVSRVANIKDASLANGWYRASASENAPVINGSVQSYGWFLVSRATFITIDYYTATATPYHCVCHCVNGEWDEWCIKNPPMTPGYEYRTTEMIDRKAVYKRNNGGIIEYRLDGETEWKPYAQAVGGLATDGSNAMTGDLNIAKPTNNNRLALASEAGYSALRHLETLTSSNDYRQLMLYGNAANLKDCLRLYSVVGGKHDATHYIYHTGNKPTAEDVGAVALDGSNAMTGQLHIDTNQMGRGVIVGGNTENAYFASIGSGGVNNQRTMQIRNADTTTPATTALQYAVWTDGKSVNYPILHTGNKPSGSYTGNGSATARTINTGGIGNFILVWSSSNGSVLLTPNGGITLSGGAIGGLSWSLGRCNGNGIIAMATDNAALNANGITYSYQVL